MADDVSLTEAQVDELLACDCGHDIAGEHNSSGCYHIDWANGDAKCDCMLSDDQDVADLVGARVSAIVTARVAAARDERDQAWREALAALPDQMADAWGGGAHWLTSGNHIASLVGEWLSNIDVDEEAGRG